MIWIFSFARSGSTILLDFLADLFGYNSIFEPFMKEPEKVKGHGDFEAVHDWFRGAPKLDRMNQFKIKNFYLGHVPVNEFNSAEIKPYKEKLKSYIKDIYHHYGSDTVVKCVRQQGNIKFIRAILDELGIKAGYILLKRNPFEAAYSYYRGGGLHRRSSWHVNQVFQYRKCMYEGETRKLDVLFHRVKNPLDKLIVSILADYRSFDESLGWLKNKGVYALNLNYEDFIEHPFDCSKTISSFFDIPVTGKKIRETVKPYDFNPSKIYFSQLDPIYSYLARKSGKRLSEELSQFLLTPRQVKKKLELWHVKCLLKNILPFIKVS